MKRSIFLLSTLFLFTACSSDKNIPDKYEGLYVTQEELTVLNSLVKNEDLNLCGFFHRLIDEDSTESNYSLFVEKVSTSGKIYSFHGPLNSKEHQFHFASVSKDLKVSYKHPESQAQSHVNFTIKFNEDENLVRSLEYFALNLQTNEVEQVYSTQFQISEEEYKNYNASLTSTCQQN
ncbi:MAG: hypothetical protein ACRBBP_09495 [Bdellovibrionales bacterium]